MRRKQDDYAKERIWEDFRESRKGVKFSAEEAARVLLDQNYWTEQELEGGRFGWCVVQVRNRMSRDRHARGWEDRVYNVKTETSEGDSEQSYLDYPSIEQGPTLDKMAVLEEHWNRGKKALRDFAELYDRFLSTAGNREAGRIKARFGDRYEQVQRLLNLTVCV